MRGRSGIEARLRKLEARRREPGMIYFAWGRSADELDAILADAFKNGELGPEDPNVCVLCDAEDIPASGWKTYRTLSEREDELLFGRIKSVVEASRAELADVAVNRKYDHLTDEQLLPMALGRSVAGMLKEA